MTDSPAAGHPPPCKVAIDDVGEFLLLPVPTGGAGLPEGKGVPGVSFRFEESFLRGPIWSTRPGVGDSDQAWEPLEVQGQEPSQGSEPFGQKASNQVLAMQRPGEGSPCVVITTGAPGLPEGGILLMPLGAEWGFRLDPNRVLGFPVPDLRDPVTIVAEDESLQVRCKGGVRLSQAGSEFDGARPERRVPWPTDGSVTVWCQARVGAPLFVTLEPWPPVEQL